jgi:enoyl-CoA hydratase/carnithine racemase
MTGQEPVARSEPRPGVVQLTLSRPGKLNALTWPLVDALHARLRDIAADRREGGRGRLPAEPPAYRNA